MAEADTGCMYVIQISVPSGVDSGNPGDVLQRARAAVKEAAGENLVHMLKVAGENVVTVALYQGAEAVTNKLNELCGNLINIECEPVMPYENWAKFLKVDEEFCEEVHDIGEDKDGILFWANAKVEYHGMSTQDLMRLWKEEATLGLGNRKKTGWPIDLYKVVTTRKVHCFTRTKPEAVDAMTWTFPLYDRMGDQIWLKTRRMIVWEKGASKPPKKE